MKSLNAFSSWSGGKDSCHALYRSLREGYGVSALFTMLHESGGFCRSHGTSRSLLERQAEALGIPVRFGSATWEGYEVAFKLEVSSLVAGGIEAGVFGDIDLQEHRDWVERVCGELSITPLLPLWGGDHAGLAREFVELGFSAAVISVRKDTLTAEWLGRDFDLSCIEELEEAGVDPAGEGGEFHTFVYDGPLFRHPVAFQKGKTRERNGYLWLELLPS
ncbi:MAG: diphthine--ammonia ligase [Actinobacteria bacterium]|nr:diphthine--ammonia ligase [Actinomycetota bacterium]